MSLQLNFLGSLNAISSPGSASGASPPEPQASPTTGRSGADRAHASLSARQAQAMGLLTIATSGRIGSGSSPSGVLVGLWASRLAAKTASLGSILYALTWKDRATPGGRSIYALRASARPISVNGSTCAGWTTSSATDGERGGTGITPGMSGSSLTQMAQMAGWPTTKAQNAQGAGLHGDGGIDLQTAAQLAGWTTASARDWKDSEGMATERPDGSRDRLDQLPRQAMLAGWKTPTGLAKGTADYNRAGNSAGLVAIRDAALQAIHQSETPFLIRCQLQLGVSGPTLIGCSAETLTGPSCGQLDAAHSAWLQGIPAELASCVRMAMRSISKSPRNSSRRSSPS